MAEMDYEKIISAAGGKFLGVEEGYVWFNAPSGSTLVLPVADCSEENARLKIIEDAHKSW